ncbi:MAG: T9SS type A sorting domain-containing protein [Bacteroidetes bacterium]|nr:T9SS type A sorting domain-containing protein [Bacteroidota bacterium]
MKHPAPIPYFTVSSFCYGDTALFTNASILEATNFWTIYKVVGGSWQAIDTSSSYNLKYLFPSVGTYKVELDCFNGHFVMDTCIINYDSIMHSNFYYQNCFSSFSNLSNCYASCFWDFGDGTTSTETNPTHYFPSTGFYRVHLSVFNGTKIDTSSQLITVYYTNKLTGTYSYKAYKDSVHFIANDSTFGPFVQYHWSYGDGVIEDLTSISGGKHRWHKYAVKDSTYLVFLLVKSICYNAYSERNIFIPDSTPVTTTTFYPNPLGLDGLFHLTLESAILPNIKQITIYDLNGKQLLNQYQMVNNKHLIFDFSNYPSGMYFLIVEYNDKTKFKKKIIKPY